MQVGRFPFADALPGNFSKGEIRIRVKVRVKVLARGLGARVRVRVIDGRICPQSTGRCGISPLWTRVSAA